VAYFNLLASVPEVDVEQLRGDPAFLLRPSRVSGASHLLAYCVKPQPLGGLLARALDGGEVIHPDLWHPYRVPLAHCPAAVRELAEQIAAAMDTAAVGDDWSAIEVGRLLRLFRHAAESGECVVSALDSPDDAERASRVRTLWRCSPDAEPGAAPDPAT
jgi:hypothetical protein